MGSDSVTRRVAGDSCIFALAFETEDKEDRVQYCSPGSPQRFHGLLEELIRPNKVVLVCPLELTNSVGRAAKQEVLVSARIPETVEPSILPTRHFSTQACNGQQLLIRSVVLKDGRLEEEGVGT